jgi:hypothetical protein
VQRTRNGIEILGDLDRLDEKLGTISEALEHERDVLGTEVVIEMRLVVLLHGRGSWLGFDQETFGA